MNRKIIKFVGEVLPLVAILGLNYNNQTSNSITLENNVINFASDCNTKNVNYISESILFNDTKKNDSKIKVLDCKDTCSGSCSGRCTAECDGGCHACQGTCSGTCKSECHGTCLDACKGTCSGHCTGTCTEMCSDGCTGCAGTCGGLCAVEYGSACSGTCVGTNLGISQSANIVFHKIY